jgi:hypothetical protein
MKNRGHLLDCQVLYMAGGYAADDSSGRDVLGHDTSRGHKRAVVNCHARQQSAIAADVDVVFYDRARSAWRIYRRQRGLADIKVGKHRNPVAEGHTITERYAALQVKEAMRTHIGVLSYPQTSLNRQWLYIFQKTRAVQRCGIRNRGAVAIEEKSTGISRDPREACQHRSCRTYVSP